MKQLVLSLLLCCLPGLLLAQRSGSVITQAAAPGPGSPPLEQPYSCFEQLSTYQLRADSILQALDKTQIPSRIRYDRTAGKAATAEDTKA